MLTVLETSDELEVEPRLELDGPVTAWDPDRYEEFVGERLQPGIDLLSRVAVTPTRVVDLGCGTGRLTVEMARRWPQASVLGVDRSPEMIEAAADAVTYELGDIETWEPSGAVDLLYANASLHWIAGQDTLFPRLARMLDPGGVLAVQMPLSWDQPSHRIMREVGSEFGVNVADPPTLRPDDYHDVLAADTTDTSVWVTTYHHVLAGGNPVFRWVSATGMMRFLNRIDPADHAAYRAECASRISAAYPPNEDGQTIFPFTRLFILALT